MPEVSVIVPNYNHAPFLKQRIESLLNQTYQDFEIVLLDDCSSDNSRDILESYRGNQKVSAIVYNAQNSGSTFNQWFKGFELAKGRLIWVAESDDLASPSFLDEAVRVFNEYPDVGIFQTKSIWIDKNDQVLPSLINNPSDKGLIEGEAFIKDHLVNGNDIHNASAVVFRKSLINQESKADIERFTYCGDWYFWVTLLLKSNIFLSEKSLNFFRRHSDNVSGRSEKDGLFFLEGLKIYALIRRKFPLSFLNPAKRCDKFWAFKFLISDFDSSIRKKYLKTALMANPMIIVLYYSYLLKQKLLG